MSWIEENKIGILAIATVTILTLLSLAMASRATDVDLFVYTDDDIFLNTNLFANGSINVNIDGTDVNQEITGIKEGLNSYLSYQDADRIFKGIRDYFFGERYNHWLSVDIFNYLNSVFVNRQDEVIINAKLNNLNVRTTALEKTMEKLASEAYCQGKMDTVKEFNLTSVTCGNTTWYNHQEGNLMIGIRPI